jgi:hypothetical protein
MELDDLKAAWQILDRRLEQQSALNLHIFRESRLDKVRGSLRRLYLGRIAQILFGDALIYFGVISSMRYHAIPHLLFCGLCMLAYGLLIVVLAGVTLARISHVDYTAPVLNIQKQVSSLHRTDVVASLCAGLPWWLLWIPIFVLEVKANLGADLFVTAPGFVWISVMVGIAGLFATGWFYRRSRNPWYPRLTKSLDNAVGARSLRDARNELDEIARFEQI